MEDSRLFEVAAFGLLCGFVLGYLLRFVLTQVKQWIALQNSPVAKEFSTYAYWILAGGACVALYMGYVRHSLMGNSIFSTIGFYAGLLIPFILKSRIRDFIERLLPEPDVLEPPIEQGLSATNDEHPVLRQSLTERLLSSEMLSIMALVLWIISLFLPVAVGSKNEITPGWVPLFIGWLGIGSFQFAWLANPFFLISFIRIQISRSGVELAVMALLLSLNTFTFPAYIFGVYGYGWGMILWFVAIALMVAAAGAFEIENVKETGVDKGGWLRPFGIGLAVLIAGISIALSIYDHTNADSEDKKRLVNIAIKRSPSERDGPHL
ncbi:hypothetical protein K5D44_08970 [Pseudomonas cichorii]|nr:hypothetical protein [Pseudomonas cichorii]MBX8539394.1 hypothetical protein [Pseudomonas cichorii]MBX8547417.1 hypothetical protein [Pseudomonas cichorii]MBX8561122.1 hypothetical protein [Pseudomonas cichorii]MBX8564821.1 hypothetical protein [Pseudomonas cichorii]MBX8579322.1 hypothetical protein [Pseudomonas cichorii]